MRKLSRPHFDLLFNISLTLVVLTIGWTIPNSLLVKIQVEVALFVISLITMYELQDDKAGKLSSVQWGGALVIGALVVALSLRLEPVWLYAGKLFLEGRNTDAASALDAHKHANLILFIGLTTIFVAIIGLVRLTLLRYFGLSDNTAKHEGLGSDEKQ